jgi:hypothetical protein
MAESKSSISNASSYSEIGEYWDDHDLAEHWNETREVVYFAVEKELAEKLRAAAKSHGVSPETLLNVWVQKHVAGETPSK